jgi:hypothetical protein
MSKSRLPPVPPGNRAPMGGAGTSPGGERNARATQAGKPERNRNPAAEAGQGKLRNSSARPSSRGAR